jgi:hypothetical protein
MISAWPGFKRLALDEKQMRDLATCPEQFDVASATVVSRPDPFLKYLEERKREVPGLVRPGAMSNLGLDPSSQSSVLRCPNCQEFVDSSAKKCRFCNSELDSREVDTAVGDRAQEKATASRKEVRSIKLSVGLLLAAAAVYFLVPVVPPITIGVKLFIVLMLVSLIFSPRRR